MIAQMNTLRAVKKLREDKAMGALQQAQAALAAAQAREQERARAVAESEAGLPRRERALFEQIIGEIVDVPRVDDVKAQVRALQARHQELVDALTRARDHVVRAREALGKARAQLRQRQAETSKTDQVLEDLNARAADAEVAREEAEVEDLFSRPRPTLVIEAPA